MTWAIVAYIVIAPLVVAALTWWAFVQPNGMESAMRTNGANRQPDLQARGLRPASELAANRPHGDRLRYIAGCRCVECRRANTEYEKARAVARKTGDWNGVIPAARAREHLATLSAAGVGRHQVADASGISDSILFGIASGARLNLRARTERAILAVTTDAAADGAYIDAKPTWRQLDELVATGYSKAALARELGYATGAIQFRRDRCTARNAYEVALLYARLRRVPAAATQRLIGELREEGYREPRIEVLARELAARKGEFRPDFRVHKGGFISAHTADLVKRLHAELTEVPA